MKIQENKPVNNSHLTAINIFPSQIYCRLILAFHALAIVTVFMAQFTFVFAGVLQTVLCAYVFVSGGYFLKQQKKYPCLRLHYQANQWVLIDTKADIVHPDALICQDVYFWSSFLLILKVEQNHHIRYWPVFWDSCHEEDFRRLRVITRFYMC